MFSGCGVGVEPRTPQNLIRIGSPAARRLFPQDLSLVSCDDGPRPSIAGLVHSLLFRGLFVVSTKVLRDEGHTPQRSASRQRLHCCESPIMNRETMLASGESRLNSSHAFSRIQGILPSVAVGDAGAGGEIGER